MNKALGSSALATEIGSELYEEEAAPAGRHSRLILPRRERSEFRTEEILIELRPIADVLLLRNPLRGDYTDNLVKNLQSDNPETRAQAADALGEKGPSASSAVFPLINALQDSSAKVQYFAAQALGNIGTHGDLVAPSLLSLIKQHPDLNSNSAAMAAASALSKLAMHKPNLVLRLVWKAATSRNPKIRLLMARTLYQVGSNAPHILQQSVARMMRSRVRCLRQIASLLDQKLQLIV